MWRIRYLISTLRDDEGIGVVEIILILVVLIGLVIISNLSLPVWCRQFSKRLPAKVREFKEIRRQKAKRRDYRIFKPDIYFASFICRCGDGKCIDPDGKELPAGGYEPGDRKRVCGISKGTSGGV